MRDPAGRLTFVGDKAIRLLTDGFQAPTFLGSKAARSLVDDGKLTPFLLEEGRIEAPRLPFVTLPTEWTDAQLLAAAKLTLDIAEAAFAEGAELKDASAWNVIFQGCVPMFCDHMSFKPITTAEWSAFGQFCRHFTFPLLVSQRRGFHGYQSFQVNFDGLTAQCARAWLGFAANFSLAAPLFAAATVAGSANTAPGRDHKAPLHSSLIAYARRATPSLRRREQSAWSAYTQRREHYSDQGADQKRAMVADWLTSLKPDWVLDVGCNTGEFSELALTSGAQVIAMDLDHDSLQKMFRRHSEARGLHPVVASLADLRGGRGWAQSEFPGLLERLEGRADVLLMLAVTHHLALADSIPLDEIAAMCSRLSRSTMIVELIGAGDPMVVRLANQRGRSPDEFSVERQLEAFSRHFDLRARQKIAGAERELALMARRA